MRGVCVLWIVWIHTDCPDFLHYPLRLPALFFISGCFFRLYPWEVFWRKKFNQLVIPFVFFYLLYYMFLVALNYLKFHTVSSNILLSVLGVFKCYTFNDAFIVNYPLWFIMALLVVQLTTYCLVKTLKNKTAILVIAVFLSLLGHYWLRSIPTPFMIGRAMPYLIYYVVGALFGMSVIYAEHTLQRKYLFVILFLYALSFSIRMIYRNVCVIFTYVEFLSATYLLMRICQFIHKSKLAPVLAFFGANSLIIFGLHDMYLTIMRIMFTSVFGEMNNFLGFCHLLVVLLLIWPSIILLNRFAPKLVAKEEALYIPK